MTDRNQGEGRLERDEGRSSAHPSVWVRIIGGDSVSELDEGDVRGRARHAAPEESEHGSELSESSESGGRRSDRVLDPDRSEESTSWLFEAERMREKTSGEQVERRGSEPESDEADDPDDRIGGIGLESEQDEGFAILLEREEHSDEAFPPLTAETAVPHWTEAPTGEVPAVVGGEEEPQADPAGRLSARTWRDERREWATEADTLEPSMLGDEEALDSLPDTEETVPDALDDTAVTPAVRLLDGEGLPPPLPPPGDALSVAGAARATSREPAGTWRDSTADEFERSTAEGHGAGGPVSVVAPPLGSALVDWAGEDETDPTGEVRGVGRGDREERGPMNSELVVEEKREERDRRPSRRSGSQLLRRHWRGGTDTAGTPGSARRAAETTTPGISDEADWLDDTTGRHGGPVAALKARRSRPLREDTSNGRPSGGASNGRRPGPARDPEKSRSGRNLPLSIATGVVLAFIAFVFFDLGTITAMIIATAVIGLCAIEAYAALRKAGNHPLTLLGLVATVALMVAAYNKGEAALPVVIVLLLGFSFLWHLGGVERVGDPVRSIASTLLVFCWIGVLGSFAALLLAPSLFPNKHGIAFLVGAVITAAAYDVGALAVGAWIGRHPLAPRVSPNKTWEGFFGGAVAAVLAAVIIVHFIHPWTIGKAAVLGIVVAVVSPIGDLSESLVKRHLGLKDMSRILPGHGGLLDRVDGLLFVLPATFYLVKAFHLG